MRRIHGWSALEYGQAVAAIHIGRAGSQHAKSKAIAFERLLRRHETTSTLWPVNRPNHSSTRSGDPLGRKVADASLCRNHLTCTKRAPRPFYSQVARICKHWLTLEGGNLLYGTNCCQSMINGMFRDEWMVMRPSLRQNSEPLIPSPGGRSRKPHSDRSVNLDGEQIRCRAPGTEFLAIAKKGPFTFCLILAVAPSWR